MGTPVVLIDLVRPLARPDGWRPLALWRLGQDPLGVSLPLQRRQELVEAAHTAGRDMARRTRQRGCTSAEDALRAEGVSLVEQEHGEVSASFVYRAIYTAPPPTVTLYRRPLAALERLLDAEGLRALLGNVDVREVILAHELFHHVVNRDGAPPEIRPRVQTLRVGWWRRTSPLSAAEEIGAAGFATAWHDLSWPSELLDCLTLVTYGQQIPGALKGLPEARPSPY